MIYSDEFIYVEDEKSEIPWLKLFTRDEFKELSDCDEITRAWLFEAALVVERCLREFYAPHKINWASFANYVPRVHIHVMARFENDSFFPQSMWGTKQRDGEYVLKRFDEFKLLLGRELMSARKMFKPLLDLDKI